MRELGLSLRWKVAISVSILLVVVTGAVALALLRYERFFLSREGEKRVQALADHLASSARDPLLDGDELRIGPVTQAVMRDPDAVYAYVVDHDSTVVFHTESGRTGSAASALPPPAASVLQASSEIVVEGTTIGMAVAALDDGFVDQALAVTARGLLVPLVIGTGVVLVGIFLLTGLHVRRIGTLEEAVQALGEGNRDARADVAGGDEVSRLAERFNDMVKKLAQARGELERGFAETVSALATAIEAKDEYTRGHCERVARMSVLIGRELGVRGDDLRDLELAAILHDVGKIGIRSSIVGKQGRLEPAEMEAMKSHPEIGARILGSLSSLAAVSSIVRCHHEHFDGSGYPAGSSGEDIPLASRIIHLVDAYDAMTTTRPYRKALGHLAAIAELESERGTQFDPLVVDAFMDLDRRGRIETVRADVEENEIQQRVQA